MKFRSFPAVLIGLIIFVALMVSLGQLGQAGAMAQPPQSFQPAVKAMVTPSAATTITVQTLSRAGILPTPITPNGTAGNKFFNNGATWMEVENNSGEATTVSIDIQKTVDGQTPPARTVSVADGARRLIGPFPPTDYNITSAGNKDYVTFVITPAVTVTVAIYSLQ